jgi:hypothetical protein
MQSFENVLGGTEAHKTLNTFSLVVASLSDGDIMDLALFGTSMLVSAAVEFLAPR